MEQPPEETTAYKVEELEPFISEPLLMDREEDQDEGGDYESRHKSDVESVNVVIDIRLLFLQDHISDCPEDDRKYSIDECLQIVVVISVNVGKVGIAPEEEN